MIGAQALVVVKAVNQNVRQYHVCESLHLYKVVVYGLFSCIATLAFLILFFFFFFLINLPDESVETWSARYT
jgi:hypothetical protein